MFKFSDNDKTLYTSMDKTDVSSQFINMLTTKWDEILSETDVFRYKIDEIQERIVEGKYLLQLNPDRRTKRRTPELIENICQPFDKNKFNFTKVSSEEFMFSIQSEDSDSDVHSLLVNVSPISRYHTLLCPSINKCLPQIVTADSLQLAINIMFLAEDRNLRIGFNSLCGLASVNHLHYHLFLEKNTLAVENLICKHIKGNLYCLNNYPVPAFCFEVTRQNSSFIVQESYKLLKYLLKKSIAHNIFIIRGQGINEDEVIRLLIWPRKSTAGVKQLTAFNVAVCELSGWFPVFDKEAYENLKADDLEKELSKWNIDNFHELCDEVTTLF